MVREIECVPLLRATLPKRWAASVLDKGVRTGFFPSCASLAASLVRSMSETPQ